MGDDRKSFADYARSCGQGRSSGAKEYSKPRTREDTGQDSRMRDMERGTWGRGQQPRTREETERPQTRAGEGGARPGYSHPKSSS